jgi:hypothetical protein
MRTGYQAESGFVLKAAAGEISHDRYMRLIEKAVFSAEAIPQQSILCDFREAFFPRESMQLLLNIAVEMAKYRLVLTSRIAHLSSRDSLQIHLARILANLLALKGFNYRSFSDMEDARAWLRK